MWDRSAAAGGGREWTTPFSCLLLITTALASSVSVFTTNAACIAASICTSWTGSAITVGLNSWPSPWLYAGTPAACTCLTCAFTWRTTIPPPRACASHTATKSALPVLPPAAPPPAPPAPTAPVVTTPSPAPSSSGYTTLSMYCPSCQKCLTKNTRPECYYRQDMRFYYESYYFALLKGCRKVVLMSYMYGMQLCFFTKKEINTWRIKKVNFWTVGRDKCAMWAD